MNENEIQENKDLVLFESNKIRRQFYNGEWNYAIADIIEILTESKNPNTYWRVMKKRLSDEGNESVTNCNELKIPSKKDGKKYKTDCANRETIFRLIQSIPSPNAEPFKLWFARLAEERIQEVIDPSLAIERARQTYLQKGYDEEWTNTRMKGIGARNNLTNEWKNRGANTQDYAILTNEISKGTFGITTQQHRDLKNLDKQNLRDNMSAMELALITLAEVTTTEIHKTNDSRGLTKLKKDAKQGGDIAGVTRTNIEKQLGKSVITTENALTFRKKKTLKTKK